MNMDDILKELQQEYIQSIPEKISEVESFIKEKNIDGLINTFHKLKGSGKTYGLEEVSVLGEFFEHWMREKREQTLQSIQIAAELLKKIYSQRHQGQPFAIEKDAEFIKLQNLK